MGLRSGSFVLSKLTSQIVVVTGIYIVSALLFSTYNYVIFDKFVVEYSLLSFISMYVYLIFITCLVNLYSTIAKSSVITIVLSFVTTILLAIFDLFKFGKYLPNYLISITHRIFRDTSLLDYAYKNIGITLLLSVIMVLLSIKLCSHKE